MSRGSAPLKAAQLAALTAAPFVAAGGAAFGSRGALAGLLTWLLLLALAALGAEEALVRAHCGRRGKPRAPETARPGLRRSFERVLAVTGGTPPALKVFSDPAPNALIGRSVTGSGVILVSQGCLALLTETELRAVLAECVSRVRGPGVRFRTLCAVGAGILLRAVPHEWKSLVLEGRPRGGGPGPVSLAVFLVMLAPVRLLWELSSFPIPEAGTPHPGSDLGTALRKMSQAIRVEPGLASDPGACQLYLVNPLRARALIPL